METGDYYNLDEMADDDYLEEAPASYMVVVLYFLTLRSRETDYLLLSFDHYVKEGADSYGRNQQAIWSVPFFTFSIDGKKKWGIRPQRAGSIRTYFETAVSEMQEELEIMETQLLYQLGINDGKVLSGKRRPYVEYKRSALQPGQKKCYYIMEKYITGLDRLSVFRLCDLEGLHQYQYFPVTDWWRHLEKDGKIRFRNKVIPENIVCRLKEPKELHEYVNPVSAENLVYTLSGYLFKLDIVNFTAKYNAILDTFKDFRHTGKDIVSAFIPQISEIISRNMEKYGIYMYSLEGDGATGAAACEDMEIDVRTLLDLFHAIRQELSDLTKNLGMPLALRCVVMHAPEFQYGKISGLKSLRPEFAGEAFIKLSRMEQKLHECITEDLRQGFSGLIVGLEKEEDRPDSSTLFQEFHEQYRGVDLDLYCFLDRSGGEREEGDQPEDGAAM